mmetsp:Transcript_7890/g.9672  ORF Transcript_7890/g.9672 Transcript_7890/m.9672 type:complete len:271 (-) Transcript_7890:17-829(-)
MHTTLALSTMEYIRSQSCVPSQKARVTFDREVCIYEYNSKSRDDVETPQWYSRTELKKFRRDATVNLHCQMKENHDNEICIKNCLYTKQEPQHSSIAIRSILIVAQENMSLCKFICSLKRNIQHHVTIATAKTSNEVLSLIEKEKSRYLCDDDIPTLGFDVIIVGDNVELAPHNGCARYNNFSGNPKTGWELLRVLVTEQSGMKKKWSLRGEALMRRSFLVGLLSNSSDDMMKKMLHMGVDTVWCRHDLPMVDNEFWENMTDVVNFVREL